MNSNRLIFSLLAILFLPIGELLSVELASAEATGKETLLEGFDTPPTPAKPLVNVWWFGKITPADITLHLEELKAKGVGGVLLIDLNGMPGVPFLSAPWLDLYRHFVKECDRLGLQVGSNVCSGWPSGGPWMSPENTVWMTTTSELVLKGPQKFSGKLPMPIINRNLYADLAVQAFPARESDQTVDPIFTASVNPEMLAGVKDGAYNTFWTPGKNQGGSITVDFGVPRPVDWAWIELSGKAATIEGSDDGKLFTKIADIAVQVYTGIYQELPGTKHRFYRVTVPENTQVREVALGTRVEVERTAALAAKRALINPMSVTVEKQRTQLDYVHQDLASIPDERPLGLNKMADLTAKVSADGHLEWEVPAGTWKIVRIGRTPAGTSNLPDYLSSVATDENFNKALKVLIDEAKSQGGAGLQFFREDNVEVGGMFNWTPNMTQEFRTRRGYDPTPYLATMAGEVVESLEITQRFLADIRRTIADCIADNHFGRWADLSHQYGVDVKAEAGGPNHPRMMSFDGLMNLGRVDIPEAEFWESVQWKETPAARQARPGPEDNKTAWDENAQNVNGKQAASAGHIYGKKLVSAEAFTSLSSRANWAIAPSDLLLYANIAFCEGINSFGIHGSATSGPEDGFPGKAFAAGTHFNDKVTWWKQAPGFLSYLSRCQYLLQQGLFVADVLYYNGDEVPNIVTAKNIDPARGFGYDYDVCNTEVLLKRLSVHDGRLVLPDGMSYKVLVLPERAVMPLAAVEKIESLIAAGATVIGPRARRTPGLLNYPQSEKQVGELAAKIWGLETDAKATGFRPYGKGKVSESVTVRAVLEQEGVAPDFAFQSSDKNALGDFIHRRVGNADIYLVINRRATTLQGDFAFRVTGKQAELWDAVTGQVRNATTFHQAGGLSILPLELAPYGSLFVVFQNPIANTVAGKGPKNFPALSDIQNLDVGWKVQFDPKWGGPAQPVAFDQLKDWAKSDQEGIQYYSGTATYRRQFTLNATDFKPGSSLYLDLGVVKNVAEVRVNGKNFGVVWCAPWRVDVSSAVKAGANELEIDVVNLWPNRMIGDGKLPEDRRFTESTIDTLYKGKHDLLPSGLLGPVRLMRGE